MSLRDYYVPSRPAPVELPYTEEAIGRLTRRIFSRHLNEGQPITMQQARQDAIRAMDYVATRINHEDNQR